MIHDAIKGIKDNNDDKDNDPTTGIGTGTEGGIDDNVTPPGVFGSAITFTATIEALQTLQ